ncbi:hypothetical protein [Nonomuraea gerenzanensis]|uniref:Secreted protein n=2 Tax=Nonomuraea gerenzanensis TaxID=93944 RepID=A0A1M4EKG7_9ACTN|nr:hypothetical protein [Nonomuraea gerenzanensis]UBU10887.1 hypothetical protein LCN96_42200 [Nonomuraea gerenzanensis]SBO99326.1 hypothetical protein BN4615_P8842 [Nonomuraea gerenzanensis]
MSLLALLASPVLVSVTGGPVTAAARAGTAPDCIARVADEQPHGLIVWLRNGCGRTMRVKVIIRGGFDGPCVALANGKSREWTFEMGSYDKTVTC